MVADPGDYGRQDTSALGAVGSPKGPSYADKFRQSRQDRLDQVILYRRILFIGATLSFVILFFLTVGIIVSVVWCGVKLTTGPLAVFVGGLTAQIVSIILVISRSVFPSDPEDFKITQEETPKRSREDSAG